MNTRFLKSLFGTPIGNTKTFFCKSCNDYTSHIRISYNETNQSQDKDHFINRAADAVWDYTPLGSTILGTPFACNQCHDKNHKGGLADVFR